MITLVQLLTSPSLTSNYKLLPPPPQKKRHTNKKSWSSTRFTHLSQITTTTHTEKSSPSSPWKKWTTPNKQTKIMFHQIHKLNDKYKEIPKHHNTLNIIDTSTPKYYTSYKIYCFFCFFDLFFFSFFFCFLLFFFVGFHTHTHTLSLQFPDSICLVTKVSSSPISNPIFAIWYF